MSKLTVPLGDKDHVQGNVGAEFNLVEYGDYECPYCGEAFPIVKEIQREFGDRLCFAFRHFPLSQVHPWAEPAAEVAEFAGAHGMFWEMHDLLYENQHSLGEQLFLKLTAELELSREQLQSALANRTYQARVRADFAGGVRSGVNGTPTFFINGQRHNGPLAFRSLREAIEQTSHSTVR
jgi:protein-disulfide isomerase